MGMIKLDVLIIGAGTAGEYAAGTAKQYADSIGMIEKGPVGGDCIFHACIPTKALVHAARAYKKMKSADFYGLPRLDNSVEYKKVKTFKDGIISGIAAGRDERWVKRGIQVLSGNARFISPNEIQVADEVVKADKIIVTTGSMPAIPPIPGLKETGYITNVEALDLENVPERLAIIGGGPIGVEFAQIFAAFGSKVHIYEAFDRIMVGEDEEISLAMMGFFEKQGVSVSTSVIVNSVESTSAGKLIVTKGPDGQEIKAEYDDVLVATGRRPAIDDLDLPAAGIEAGKKGITVDASLQTSAPHIWAAGDVTGMLLFTFVAGEQGKTAVMNAVGGKRIELTYDILPRATFCDPEVASVGLTERQAQEKGYRVKSGKYDYANLTRAIVSGETDGFIKIVAEEGSGRILGGHIVGVEASSLIHEVAAAMAGELSVSDIGNTLHAYPTLSEGVRYACQAIM
jgi:pyruvate/2-oxoglutarate dehydrogenase complex dihydrolipoamide dehydrogenase (E3) component